MSTAAINPKGPRVTTSSSGPLAWVMTYLGSSVGQKILVGITGLSLVTFLVFHMIGNLKMLYGEPEPINKYAVFLKHDLGALIWVARAGLLGGFLLHLTVALWLRLKSNAARPIGYSAQRSAQATAASKTMAYTGIVILAFTLFHLAHYTFLIAHQADLGGGRSISYADLRYTMPDGTEVHNVYAMVIAGFTTWWISILYLLAQVVLFVHLSHGIPSSLQTLGLVGKRFTKAAKLLGWAVAGVIVAGNFAIVLAIQLKLVK